MVERWPPVYDAQDLASTIAALSSSATEPGLYGPKDLGPPICQGDVLALPAGLPVLEQDGTPMVLEPDFRFWLVIGNTCDFSREAENVPWTQLVPIHETLMLNEVGRETLAAFTSYQYSRRFYLPPWHDSEDRLRYADFLTPVAIEKSQLIESVDVVARMSREGWILLHSCLVRFLCRDDGRFD